MKREWAHPPPFVAFVWRAAPFVCFVVSFFFAPL